MTDRLSIEIAGEELVLDACRAVYWPRAKTLLATDVHFGKAHVLRQAGVALPRGSTSNDLARLDRLVDRHRPERFIVLGDVVHGKTTSDAQWIARVREWRAKHAHVEMIVVEGNHDRHHDPADVGFEVRRTMKEGPFAFAHYAKPIRGHYVLSGHIHPGVELVDHGGRMRLPVFWLGAEVGVLPAFGRLTGLYMIEPAPGDRIVAIAKDDLVPIPARALARRS